MYTKTENSKRNAQEAKNIIAKTSFHSTTELPEYQRAKDLVKLIKQMYANCKETKWANWWQQIDRSSMSVVLNITEAKSKNRGYLLSQYQIARGSAHETAAAIDLLPEELRNILQEKAKIMVETLDEAIIKIADNILQPMDDGYDWT